MFDIKENKFIYCSSYVSGSSRGIRDIRDKNRVLLKNLKETKILEKREELINELILNNRPLVWYIVKNLSKYYDWIEKEIDDIIGQGYVYLCEAARAYNYQQETESPVKYFGVYLYYQLIGKLKYFIKSRNKAKELFEIEEVDPSIESIPDIIDPINMEIEYLLYCLDEILLYRERQIVLTIYKTLQDGEEISDAVASLASSSDLSRDRIRQLRDKAFRKIQSRYKDFLDIG